MAWKESVSTILHTSTYIPSLKSAVEIYIFTLLISKPIGSCSKIINNNQPGPGEHHGCPFRHFSEESLRVTFASVGVRNEAYVREIINLVRNKHYQVACTRYYEITRGGERGMMDTIEHPNHFFEQSYKLSIKQGDS